MGATPAVADCRWSRPRLPGAARSRPPQARRNPAQNGHQNTSQLGPPGLALYRAEDEVLHYLWDPVGVASVPEARDEYHGYLPHVCGMLKSGSIEDELAGYLGGVATNRMGLASRPDHDRTIDTC